MEVTTPNHLHSCALLLKREKGGVRERERGREEDKQEEEVAKGF